MYRKILVPLDGSEFSECSLEHVRTVAKGEHGTEVILLMVVEPPQKYYLSRRLEASFLHQIVEASMADAQKYLSQLVDTLKKEGVNTQVAVTQGKPADEILDYATKSGVDLIVMTTHGRSGVSRFAFGSVAEKVIRNSTVPVLSISPSGCTTGELR